MRRQDSRPGTRCACGQPAAEHIAPPTQELKKPAGVNMSLRK
jgi:hypothetical protein